MGSLQLLVEVDMFLVVLMQSTLTSAA